MGWRCISVYVPAQIQFVSEDIYDFKDTVCLNVAKWIWAPPSPHLLHLGKIHNVKMNYHLMFILWRKVHLQTPRCWKHRKSPCVIPIHLFTIKFKGENILNILNILNLFRSVVNTWKHKDILSLLWEILCKLIGRNQSTENLKLGLFTMEPHPPLPHKCRHNVGWYCRNNCWKMLLIRWRVS